MQRALILFMIFCFSCSKDSTLNLQPEKASPLPDIAIEGNKFIDEDGKEIILWGFNYDRSTETLMEDHWGESDFWKNFRDDFYEMKALGANIVRLHLQYNKYMDSPLAPNAAAFANLSQMVTIAEESGLYLDITGLGSYRKSDSPQWYNDLNEEDRWNAHAKFWEEVARTVGSNPSILVYDLMNEPTVPTMDETDWLFGDSFGGFFFVQRLTLTPGNRTQAEIWEAWINKMTAAIRKHDSDNLITIGFLPFANIDNFAPHLDYVSTHIYPRSDDIQRSTDLLQAVQNNKPIVVEEIANLYATAEEVESFINENKDLVQGWIGFYRGKDFDELGSSIKDKLQKNWLEMFVRSNPNN